MSSRLNDNEVAMVAEMQQVINTYESFIMSLGELIGGNLDQKMCLFTEVPLIDTMGDIRNFIEKAVKVKEK